MSERGLAGRVVVVTGGASGIGLAGARRFLAEGARVALADVDDAALEEAARTLGEPDRVLPVACDVTVEDQVGGALDRALSQWGRLDVVWNNAGVEVMGPAVLVTESEYRRIFDVNVLGVVWGCKHALSRLEEGGVILNTASVAGLIGVPMQELYAASKAAVVSITRTVALEGAERGVRCSCLCPAVVETPLVEQALGGPLTPEVRQRIASSNPAGRIIDPDEVAAAAVYLASADAASMTGNAFVIDGGMTAGVFRREEQSEASQAG